VSGNSFRIGAAIGTVLCIMLNAFSLLQVRISCADCPVTFGFPFSVAAAGGLGGGYQILWLGLAADLLLCLGLGIGAAEFFEARSRQRKRLKEL
jgi:hypothetical protein